MNKIPLPWPPALQPLKTSTASDSRAPDLRSSSSDPRYSMRASREPSDGAALGSDSCSSPLRFPLTPASPALGAKGSHAPTCAAPKTNPPEAQASRKAS